ncbi:MULTISPECIES: hypothetical protein [Actinoallomurus]|uniref:hypothetical protein n=1 Tax=Actinoallomurus TaxID=667113 RepID=UPI002093492F|nr:MULTISPECIES: hypothetical protein [Actinoallomurus]MCO5967592.1 hypothetical protein [Actinoallomurus soli]MCO5999759.1 hypothetical protein [Actinoallomurus rhizosphaericola]
MRKNIAGAAVNKAAESRPDKKVTQSAGALKNAPKKAAQETVMKGLRAPVVGKALKSLALGRLVRVLGAAIRFIGPRAVPVALVLVAGWFIRRLRKK